MSQLSTDTDKTTSGVATAAAGTVAELWYTRCPVPTASSIAIAKGWFEDEFAQDGIVIASLRASGDTKVRESHFDHNQPNSFRQGGNIPPLWARSRGRDIRLLGLTAPRYYQAVLSMPDSGIEKPSDLKGKRLAWPKRLNDQIDFFRAGVLRGYLETLAQAGLGRDDVEFVDLTVTESYIEDSDDSQRGQLFGARANRRLQTADLIALIRGEVDAIFVSGGRGVDLQALLDANVVFDIGAQPKFSVRTNNIAPIALTVSGELLERSPDIVARYVATTLIAAEWAKSHALETRRIVALEAGVSEAWIDLAHPGVHEDMEPSFAPELVTGIESQKDFLLDNGFLEADFEFDDWIATEPLETAYRLLEDGFGGSWRPGIDGN